MKRPLQHIEDFVRGKLSLLEGDAQTDWLDFDQKLRRATRIRRIKRAAGMVGLILLLGFSQTFISGDWPLNRSTRHQEVVRQENTKPAQKIDAAPELMELSTENSETAMSVVHSNPRATSTAVITEEANESLEAESSSSTTLATTGTESESIAQAILRTNPVLAMADPSSMETAVENSVEEAPIERSVQETVVWEPKAKTAPKSLPNGHIIKNGEVVAESSLPFNYVAPALSLNDRMLDARSPDFMKSNAAEYTPYISPLQEVRPWTYSLNIYPNFAFREFKIDRQRRSLLHSDFIDAMQASEASGVNLSIGFEISKRIGPITYLNSGIEYINNSYNAEFDFLNFRQANFNSGGEIINYTLLRDPQRITFADLNSFHFLNFPLSISYQPWASDHLRINLEFGFSMLYFLEAQGSTIDYRSLEIIDLSERNYRKYMASSSLKIGVQYYLSQNMNIGLEPTLMYFTNSIYTEEYPFEVIPYSLGLNLNLQMKLQ